MDLATTIGFFGGIAAVVGTMLTGGHIMPFVSMHGFTIVFVGGFFAVMYTAPMPVFLASFKAMGTAFKKHDYDIAPLAELMSGLAATARSLSRTPEGMAALAIGMAAPCSIWRASSSSNKASSAGVCAPAAPMPKKSTKTAATT